MKDTKEKTQKQAKVPKWLKAVLVYCVSLIVVIGIIFGVYSITFADRIYPRVSVAGIMVGGLKQGEAQSKLQAEMPSKTLQPVIITTEDNQSFTIKPEEIDAAYDLDASVKNAMAIGRSSRFIPDLIQKIISPIFGSELPAAIKVNDQKYSTKITEITSDLIIKEVDAHLLLEEGVVSIVPETEGRDIDLPLLKQNILDRFGDGEREPVKIAYITKEPLLKKDSLVEVKKQAEAIVAQTIIFTYEGRTFTASPGSIGGWIETKPVKGLLKTNAELYFNEEKIGAYIGGLAKEIDKEPINARLAVIGGSINIIESSRDGLKLNRDEAKADIIRLLSIRKELPAITVVTASPSPIAVESIIPLASGVSSPDASPTTEVAELANNEVALNVTIKKPDVTNDNINQIGIKERIAVSTTDFKGSPNNRAENIKLGTKLFNGIILKPGDKFSAVKSLGRIDESAGFKPELVIKQDQLIPEVGGGLCQVSTTLFRAAMNAGLQIDARKNHRFRVSYYEAKPANPDPEDYVTLNAKTLVGMDATIYDPQPDFEFTNDTASYILIQGKVEGTRVTFELFGTKDGRKTSIDGPYITSTIPAPTDIQYIDDPTLPAGVTKVKEKAVAGAKTSFTYMVEKDGKQIHKNTFNSTYVAWQRKDYRGTGPATPASPEATPMFTPSVQGAATEAPAPTGITPAP